MVEALSTVNEALDAEERGDIVQAELKYSQAIVILQGYVQAAKE